MAAEKGRPVLRPVASTREVIEQATTPEEVVEALRTASERKGPFGGYRVKVPGLVELSRFALEMVTGMEISSQAEILAVTDILLTTTRGTLYRELLRKGKDLRNPTIEESRGSREFLMSATGTLTSIVRGAYTDPQSMPANVHKKLLDLSWAFNTIGAHGYFPLTGSLDGAEHLIDSVLPQSKRRLRS